LLTCCCTCLCTYFLCHGINSGCVYCGGYPTCKPATNLPYFKNPLRHGCCSVAKAPTNNLYHVDRMCKQDPV
jgi:hypothetical protein